MCGIAGKISFNSNPIDTSVIKKMTDTIAHRGPDGEGVWVNENKNIGLGHRRLAIIDLSSQGHQPMESSFGFSITFNGEIYNYLELKKALETKGYSFKTQTDTEVILVAYKEYGVNCLQYFDGMFAFAIWDENKQELFCARDRFGEKPFFYHKDKNGFTFASEMKALFSVGIPKTASRKMLYHYLVYDVVENPHAKKETFYENIYQIPPSSYLTIKKNGEITTKKYWDIDLSAKNRNISLNNAVKEFKALFDESIRYRMRSDVCVGASFSGGLDSSSIVATILRQNKDIDFNTFTARFEDENYDEGTFIDMMKNDYSFSSNFTWPNANLAIDELDKIFYHQEEPFGSTSIIAQWEVMKLAKEKNVTVLLDGQGADEVLAGYFKYFTHFLAELYRSNKTNFKTQLEAVNKHLGCTNFLDKSFYRSNKFPNLNKTIGNITRPYRIKNIATDLHSDLLNEFKKEPSPFIHSNNLNESLYFDTFQYGLGKLLRFSDRNAMAFSREVRLPYLSHKLVEFVFSLPNELKIESGWTKYILRNSMEGIVPKEICWRKDKKGFQAPSSWMDDKKVVELVNDSFLLVQKEKYVTKISPERSWRYVMAVKAIQS